MGVSVITSLSIFIRINHHVCKDFRQGRLHTTLPFISFWTKSSRCNELCRLVSTVLKSWNATHRMVQDRTEVCTPCLQNVAVVLPRSSSPCGTAHLSSSDYPPFITFQVFFGVFVMLSLLPIAIYLWISSLKLIMAITDWFTVVYVYSPSCFFCYPLWV